mgnify:CR=1 FL=1
MRPCRLPVPVDIASVVRVLSVSALATGALAAVACSGPPVEPADRLSLNARVLTQDEARPEAEAVAVRGDRIAWVGTTAEAARRRGPATRGRRVKPGVGDKGASWSTQVRGHGGR